MSRGDPEALAFVRGYRAALRPALPTAEDLERMRYEFGYFYGRSCHAPSD